jgi:hypothetical protein
MRKLIYTEIRKLTIDYEEEYFQSNEELLDIIEESSGEEMSSAPCLYSLQDEEGNLLAQHQDANFIP